MKKFPQSSWMAGSKFLFSRLFIFCIQQINIVIPWRIRYNSQASDEERVDYRNVPPKVSSAIPWLTGMTGHYLRSMMFMKADYKMCFEAHNTYEGEPRWSTWRQKWKPSYLRMWISLQPVRIHALVHPDQMPVSALALHHVRTVIPGYSAEIVFWV